MCFSCRCFAAFPHRWWETCQSWRITRPRPVWPKRRKPALRRSCAKSEVSLCSFLWTSCLNTTSCPQLEQRSPWSQRRSGREGREVLNRNPQTPRRARLSGQSLNVEEITHDIVTQTSDSAGHLKIATQNHYTVKFLLVSCWVCVRPHVLFSHWGKLKFGETFSPLDAEIWKEMSCLFKGPQIGSRNYPIKYVGDAAVCDVIASQVGTGSGAWACI